MNTNRTPRSTRRRLAGPLFLAAAIAQPAPAAGASQPAERFAFEAAATDPVTCPSGTYTFVSGEFVGVFHYAEGRSGNTSYALTVTPRHVVVVDEDGRKFAVRGLGGRDGGTTNDQTGSTAQTTAHKMVIVGPGGVVETFNVVEHGHNGDSWMLDMGTCDVP